MKNVEQRFWEKVNTNGPLPEHHPELGNCWLWTGARTAHGYGNFWTGNRNIGAHAFLVAAERGLHRDHLCRVPLCVRPSHIEAVSVRENQVRGAHGMKTACRRGHPYAGPNLYIGANGRRQCRTCRNVRAIDFYRMRKVAS